MFKNKVHVELSKRWIGYSTIHDLFNGKGREYQNSHNKLSIYGN